MENPAQILDSLKQGLRAVFTENTMSMAAALSYISLLALVPLATVVLTMMSIFPVFSDLSEQFQDFIYSNMVPTAGDIVRENIQKFVDKAGALTTFGFVFLFGSALMMLSTIEDTLNKIWDVHQGRTIAQRVLVYWAMISLGPILIGTGLSISSYFAASSIFETIEITGSRHIFTKLALPFLFESGAFVLTYFLMPNCSVKLSHALIGGLLASLLFQLGKKAFAYYILKFNTYEVIYGALATLPIFLIWIFLCWNIFLLGAQIAANLSRLLQTEPDEC